MNVSKVLIIGGGITGAITAYFLAKEGVNVIIAEKNIVRYGSTLAATAFLDYEASNDILKLEKTVGKTSASKIYKLCDDATFEAWVHGPVCKKLYDVYSNNYGQVEKYDGDINPLITGELKKFLDNIYKTFGKYSGDELESMAHREMPWQNARNTLAPYMPSYEVISEEDMFVYYNSNWVRKNQKLLINQNQWFK